jgi:hypothetical protein
VEDINACIDLLGLHYYEEHQLIVTPPQLQLELSHQHFLPVLNTQSVAASKYHHLELQMELIPYHSLTTAPRHEYLYYMSR